jgi:hypothetical protein
MEFKKGFCRIETKEMVLFGEITETQGSSISIADFAPSATEMTIKKTDIIICEAIKEEDIPPYE